MNGQTNTNLSNIMIFRNDFITDVMDWAVENVFSKIWNDPRWMRCAKGGDEKESYKNKPDMFYVAHIFSGIAMALKVADYKYTKSKPRDIEETELKLKRSVIGYMFHDYNKLEDYSNNINMNNTNILSALLDDFKDLLNDLKLTFKDIYFIAFSTEKGTQFHGNSIDIIPDSDLSFESNFSRLSDQLSSIFLEDNPVIHDIKFNNEPVIPKNNINKISINSTQYITLTSIIKGVLTDEIIKKGEKNIDDGFYLWSTLNSIYYVSNKPMGFNYDELADLIMNKISNIANLENGITFTDRRVDISSNKIGYISIETLKKFVLDNDKFRQVMHLEDIILKDNFRGNAEKYSDLISGKLKSYSINFYKDLSGIKNGKKKEHSIRDYLELSEVQDYETDKVIERLHTFLIRFIQLNSDLFGEDVDNIRSLLASALDQNKNLLADILPKKNQEKSALLIPLIIDKENINWDVILNSVLKQINIQFNPEQNKKLIFNLLNLILGDNEIELPEVPDKKNMSMINGYPKKEGRSGIASKENLFGIGTNSFNNRLITSIANGKIDEYSIYEFSIRSILAPRLYSKYSSAVLFLSFPGAIPFMDVGKFLQVFNERNVLQVANLRLTIEENSAKMGNFRFDSTYYIYLQDPKSDADFLKNLIMCIDIAKKSKMHVLISFSNNLFYNSWNETINIEIESSILNSMKWNKLRCNNLDSVESEISFFMDASKVNGNLDYDNCANVIRDYIRNNLSLNYYVHKQLFDNSYKFLDSKDRQEIFHKLVYDKRGEIMKEVENLGNMAADLYLLKRDSSASDRGWMLRESLEVLEKMKAETNAKNLEDLKEFVSGHLYKGMNRLYLRDNPNSKYKPDINKINDFAGELINLIINQFKGRIPAGNTRSYLIDGFEIEYYMASIKN
ncbi:hypothetical protein [Acidiplasma aeolicum]|jgi:hypothetical protein|uniref:hypothetical protein n=1 Tax=Acidiplasma aeolicum TaxID=507754 RepID=UPI0037126EE8